MTSGMSYGSSLNQIHGPQTCNVGSGAVYCLENRSILGNDVSRADAHAGPSALTLPMLPDGVRPRPPIRPAHMSERMSPYKFGITMTRSENGLGLVTICSKGKHEEGILSFLMYLQADSVQEIFIVGYIRKFLRNLTAGRKEHSIGHFPV